MTLQSVKTALIAMLALLLGAGHAACACMNSMAADHHSAVADMPMGVHGAHKERRTSGDHAKHDDHAPCHDEMTDCTHCAAAVVVAASPGVPLLAVAASAPHPETMPAAAFAIPPPRMTAPNQNQYQRWRAPPRIDPVSQKIRLLI